MYNYISDKLIRSNSKINLTPEHDRFIDSKVAYIQRIFDSFFSVASSFKKYNELRLAEHYHKIREPSPFINPDNDYVNYNPSCASWAKMNATQRYQLIYNGNRIDIDIMYSTTANQEILERNINKIMTRLYNLCVIYDGREVDGIFGTPNTYIHQSLYKFYLYNNPRRANKNKSGKEYLKELNASVCKCFNTSSGLTNLMSIFTEERFEVYVSRTEEILGLLTHEVLHVVRLFQCMPPLKINGSSINTTEIFINSFASIFNAYLFSIETGTDIRENLRTELLYSLNHFIRLLHITGFTFETILTDLSNWYQNAYLFEYIVGRIIVLFNIEHFLDQSKILEIFTTKRYKFNMIDDCELLFKSLETVFTKNANNDMLNTIISQQTLFIDKVENDEVCGNMIMQYFALDPMEIEPENHVPTLYGGNNNFKYKYLKYKQKYFELKNKN